MFGPIHTLMQDSGDANDDPLRAIDDHVGPDEEELVRRRHVRAWMPDLWTRGQQPQRFVQFVAVNQQLLRTPDLSGVTQDIDDVLSSPR